MPKIIENVRENIITEGRKLLINKNYKDLSIREIAKNCGIATGTFYNYFDSKESLATEIFRDDWAKSIKIIEELKNNNSTELKEKIRVIYDSMETFLNKYLSVFYEITMLNKNNGSWCHREFSDINSVLIAIIEMERKKNTLNSKLSSEKLSNLIMSNLLYLSKSKYMTFDELYENLVI